MLGQLQESPPEETLLVPLRITFRLATDDSLVFSQERVFPVSFEYGLDQVAQHAAKVTGKSFEQVASIFLECKIECLFDADRQLTALAHHFQNTYDDDIHIQATICGKITALEENTWN